MVKIIVSYSNFVSFHKDIVSSSYPVRTSMINLDSPRRSIVLFLSPKKKNIILYMNPLVENILDNIQVV